MTLYYSGLQMSDINKLMKLVFGGRNILSPLQYFQSYSAKNQLFFKVYK